MEKIKITSGEFKGREISTPGKGTHPMGSRERLALFNMISDYVPGAFVLDAFAGSGALGIEALSRGASFVVFIENEMQACRTIHRNLSDLELYGRNGGVLHGNAYRMLSTATDRFSLVLADPPYDEYDEKKIKVLARVVANPGGILVLSHPGEAPEMPGLVLVKSKQYAAAHISVYCHPGHELVQEAEIVSED